MRFSKLSEEARRDMLADAANPAYRAMNAVDAQLGNAAAARTPDENLMELVLWLKVLANLNVDLGPERELPRTDVNIL